MYRGSYPSPQHPSSQPSMSPGMSPRPMSPASSASPVPGAVGKSSSMHPAATGPTSGGQPNSSLQQLEQMVMPGAKDSAGQMLQQQQQQPKTPKSPSVRGGHSTPLSPQQWPPQQQGQPSSRPRSHSGKEQTGTLPPPGASKVCRLGKGRLSQFRLG
jgi:hypothetical protein